MGCRGATLLQLAGTLCASSYQFSFALRFRTATASVSCPCSSRSRVCVLRLKAAEEASSSERCRSICIF